MKTIILGTAHLKSTPGKCSPDKKFFEYKYSRELCKTIRSILQTMGYTVLIDIEDDDIAAATPSKELSLRCTIVNELQKTYKNCIYVSIHVNAAGDGSKWMNATGWSAYTSVGLTSADRLASCLYEAAKKNLTGKKLRTDLSDKDSDLESNFYILKHTNCPAVLTENFF
jgi:N-acetylmuramoyl-L-alanine amidase